MRIVFIPANLHIIVMAVLMACPYYFFNRYLAQRIKPKKSGKRLMLYFILVLITASMYSIASVILMVWYAKYRY
jgi:hypothetical protein